MLDANKLSNKLLAIKRHLLKLTCSSHARRASSNLFALIISRTFWLRRLFSENALEF